MIMMIFIVLWIFNGSFMLFLPHFANDDSCLDNGDFFIIILTIENRRVKRDTFFNALKFNKKNWSWKTRKMQGKKSLGNIDEECGMSVTSSSSMILKTLFSKQCATKGAKENKRESAIEHVLWWIFFCHRLCCGFLHRRRKNE